MRTVYCLLFTLSFFALASIAIDKLEMGSLLNKVTSTYGSAATERTRKWFAFLKENQHKHDWQKLHLVNHFFNRHIKYQIDKSLWGKNDYWANPIETLGRGKGDCEDYAIAKYFSLVALGVPESKIRLMYVRQLTVNEPHMVLIYFKNENEPPLVLDNFNKKVLPASKRRDLKPIYSFNGQGLWMAKARGLGKKVKNSRGVSAWNKMLERIEHGELNTYDSIIKGNTYAKNN